MKNKFFIKRFLVLLAALSFGSAGVAFASSASVSFSPESISATAGRTFTVSVILTPNIGQIYTGKIQVKFPADSLEVKSFKLGDGFMSVAQAGYDLADNAGGILLKTGGYPGGLSAPATFGTITFLAKKSGQASITLDAGNSLVLDSSSRNVLTGSASVPVTIAPAAVRAQNAGSASTDTAQTGVTPAETTASTSSLTQTNQEAAVSAAVSQGSGNQWLWVLIGIIVVAIVGFGAYSLGKRKS